MSTGVKPWLVGMARAVIQAATLAALVAAINVMKVDDLPPELQTWAPLILFLARSIEGGLDQRHDPAPQASLIKGGPLNPPAN